MDLVVGLDSSTTSTKAVAWDREGRAVAEGRAPVPMATPAPDAFEQEPEDWWVAAAAALRELFARVDPARVAALAISNQRETVGFLDADGRSVRPALVWLDARGRPDVALLAAAVGADRLLEVSGKAPDVTPAIYSMHWLRRTEPAAYARTARFVDVHGFLVLKLTGAPVTSWGSADPHGLFDIAARRYDPGLLAALDLREARLLAPRRPGTLAGTVTAAAAAATGLPEGTPVAIGGGDGQAAGLGTATLSAGRCYLNLGTATVAGVWGPEPRTGRGFRTLTSLDGEGYIHELCLRTGALLTDWLVTRVFGLDPTADPGCFDRLEAEAASVPPGSGGLLLQPYWSGCMPPYWDPDARGLVVGWATEHGRGHLYRALVEGIALDLAMGLAGVEAATGERVAELVAMGGGARSALWRQVAADATGRDVVASPTLEASGLGAGMLAAVVAGWYPDAASAARAMCGEPAGRDRPDPARHARYRELRGIYEGLHPAMARTHAALARFRQGDARA